MPLANLPKALKGPTWQNAAWGTIDPNLVKLLMESPLEVSYAIGKSFDGAVTTYKNTLGGNERIVLGLEFTIALPPTIQQNDLGINITHDAIHILLKNVANGEFTPLYELAYDPDVVDKNLIRPSFSHEKLAVSVPYKENIILDQKIDELKRRIAQKRLSTEPYLK